MRQMARISLVVCVLVSVILIGGGAFAQSTQNRRRIVTFEPGTTLNVALQVVEDSGIDLVHNLWLLTNGLAIELPSIGTQLVEDLLKLNPLVEEVYDDTVAMVDGGSYPICIDPASPPASESYPWGLQKIEVPAVQPQWQGSGVMVAILDTGIRASHPELKSQIGEGYNARREGESSMDDNGHGTHMAGIIAAALNSPALVGIVGVAPQTTILPVKVLDRYGAGYLSDVINGLQWVFGYNNGSPLVINMSIGFSSDIPPLRRAIQELYASDVIMVASAGNRCDDDGGGDEGGGGDDCEGPTLACDPSQTTVKYPAAYHSWVLSVAATEMNDAITAYSLTEPQVDVAAPGGSKATGKRILSTTKGSCPGGCYGEGSGTSQAAAHVTGAVAVALQLQSGLSLPQVRNLLQKTAEGPGRINVKKMVQALQ